MRVAIIQMQSSNKLGENLKKMEQWVESAAKQKADLAVFPELTYFTGRPEECKKIITQYDEILDVFKGWAKTFGIGLIPGTLREPVKTQDAKAFNTLVYIEKHGHVVAKYRKIFLFRALLPDREYNENAYCAAGTTNQVYESDPQCLGFSICYDLRFPELFRSLKKQGAQIVFLPSAFTVPTGKAHWEVLVRARAIENQYFVVAPDLVGQTGDGSEKYGHSLIISPWGEVLADLKTDVGIKVVELDPLLISEAATKVDAWGSRREDIYPIKQQ